MKYFAYGSNLNAKAVADWCRLAGHRAPALNNPVPVILENYRLCFPIFSEYWNGGTGDIEYDPGKYVMGAIFDITEADFEMLDVKVIRKLDAMGNEVGVYKRIEVPVIPLGGGAPISTITYQGVTVEKYHIPPTRFYMDLLIQGAYAAGLSMMWISYLQSFSMQEGRPPKLPKK